MQKALDIDIDEFRKYAETHTVAEIAEHFRICKISCYKVIHTYGVRYLDRKAQMYLRCREISKYLETHTNSEACSHFKIAKTTLCQYRKQHLVPSGKKRYEEMRCREFWEKNSGLTVAEIARKYGMAYMTVSELHMKYAPDVLLKNDLKRKQNGDKKEMICELAEKYSQSSIARLVGCSREYIRQVLEKCDKK